MANDLNTPYVEVLFHQTPEINFFPSFSHRGEKKSPLKTFRYVS